MISLQICVSLFFLYHFMSIEGFVFHRGSDFMTVAKTDAFVDKTMLIKQIFQAGPRLLITAPRKFGKSMNLNMLKTFLSIDSFRNKTIRDTFMKLKIGQNNTKFFNQFFGRYVVVSVNFKAGIIKSYLDAINFYKRAILEAFPEHKYLMSRIRSHKDNPVEKWFGKNSSNNVNVIEINYALDCLFEMVKKYNYRKKIAVLVDNYDSVINKGLFKIHKDSEFMGIVSRTSRIIESLIRKYADLAVITGNTYISSMGLFNINNFRRYYFLGNHNFAQFYGLTESEVALLYVKDDFVRQSKKQNLAKKFYNGYVTLRETHIYNTYSLLNFLETGKTILYWDTSDYITNLLEVMKFPEMAKIVDSLLSYESVTTEVKYIILSKTIEDLRNVYFLGHTIGNAHKDILLSHFLELGLLTYDAISRNSSSYGRYKVKIPNAEIHGIIFKNVMKYFSLKCNLSWFFAANYPTLKKYIYGLYNSTIGRCKRIVVSFIEALKKK